MVRKKQDKRKFEETVETVLSPNSFNVLNDFSPGDLVKDLKLKSKVREGTVQESRHPLKDTEVLVF